MKRNKLQKTVFSVICIVLAVIMMLSLVITVLPAHAVDETDLERLAEKRAQLEEQLMEQEQVIQGLTENQTLIVFRKAALDKQISLNRETIALIEEQIAVYQELIDRKEEELSAATAAETEQTALLRERIRSMEENDSYSYLAFIFEANSVPEILSRIADVNDIMHYDRELEKSLQQSREDVETIKREYEEAKAEQDAVNEELIARRDQLSAQVTAACELIANLDELSQNAQAEYDAIALAEDEAMQELLKAMQEYAAQDEATKRQLAEERSAQAMEEFGDLDAENNASASTGNASDENWQDTLEIDKQGRVKDTLGNLALILRNDPKLKDIAYNIHRSGIDIRRDADGKTTLPWTQLKPGWNESDLGAIQIYLERVYNLYTPSKLKSILPAIAAERNYHPVRDYIESLPAWDGAPRVDTLFIDYLGSPDTLYIRAIARKMMVAAVARIYEPGIKFDSVVVLNGPQGMGKSSFFAKLGGKWFSDSLTISDMKDKAAPEKLQGYWILELGELAGLKKMDVETVKAFITRQDDKFRHSYGYSVEDHPRQCIIVGSTNNGDGFLRDVTGNRRFWPVTCTANSPHRPWEVESVVPQLWAEAWQLYKNGEKLFLTPEEEKQAEMEQTAALESDVREGMIAEYLNTLLPEDWDKMDLAERRGFLRGDQFTGGNRTGTIQRTTVCAVEIWAECFGKDPSTIKRSDTYDIFGMLMKIGGWEKYSGNRNASLKRAPYGTQRCFVRVNALPDGCASENAG